MDQLDPQVVTLAKAIKRAETGDGDTYNAVGDNGTSRGAYQFQDSTWKGWAQKHLGDANAPLSMENQNKVAYSQIKEWKDQGYTPAQIASAWNSGSPDKYRDGTGVGYNAKIGVNYNVPEYVSKVSGFYNQLKGGGVPHSSAVPAAGATQQPVEMQKANLRAEGEPVSVQENRAQPTFAGKLIRGIIKPVATLLARPVQLAKALGGASEEEQTIKSGYLGDIKTSSSAKDVVKDVGRGLETVALGVGGGGAANIAKGIGKQSVKQLAVQGAKEGVIAGALGSTGLAMEEGKKGEDVIKEGLEGAALGGATGGLLGGAIPLAGKAIKGAANATSKIGRATGLISPTADDAGRALQSVAEEYERAAGTGLKNSFRKQQLTRSGELRPWSQTLAEYGIVPKEGPNKSWDVAGALDDLDGINDEFRTTKREFVKNESALFDVDEALSNADNRIDQTMKSEIGREKAKAQLRSEVEAVLKKAKVVEGEGGKRMLNATDMEKLRDIGYELTPFNASDPQKIGQSAGYSLARAVNDTIDKYATFPSYRSFNREWSNILNAQDALNQLSTKTVRFSKGLSGQIAMKVLAPVLGYSRGGIVGAILGDLGGEAAGRLLSDPELRTLVSRSIIKKAGQKLPKDKIIGQLKKEIADYVASRQGQLQLPGPSFNKETVVDGVRKISSGPTIQLGGYTSPDANKVQLIQGKNAQYADDVYLPKDKLPVIDAGSVDATSSKIPNAQGNPNVFSGNLRKTERYVSPDELPTIPFGKSSRSKAFLRSLKRR
jgi:hypothetical protein